MDNGNPHMIKNENDRNRLYMLYHFKKQEIKYEQELSHKTTVKVGPK